MKKKRIIVAALALVLFAAVTRGTMAWFVDSKGSTNKFTTGTVSIDMTEDFVQPDAWTPGTATDKTITIKNTGSLSAYVRVYLVGEWQQNDNGNWVTASNPTLPIDNVTMDMYATSGSGWVKHTDGYYYYRKALDSKKSTDPSLKVKVTFVTGDKNYENKRFVVRAVSEAVQSANNACRSVWGVDVPAITK